MKTSKLISLFLLFLYLTLCFLLNIINNSPSQITRVERNKELFIAEIMNENKNMVKLSYSAKDYDERYTETVLRYPVVADTTLRNIVFENNAYFLKAEAETDSESKILLKLKINKTLAENLTSCLYTNCIVVADITRVLKLPFTKELPDIDEKIIWHQKNYDIVLEGELIKIALVETKLQQKSAS